MNQRQFIKKVHARRIEFFLQSEASRMRNTRLLEQRQRQKNIDKEYMIYNENKLITKNEKMAEKLSKKELLMIEKLQNTYDKHKSVMRSKFSGEDD